MGPLVAAAVPWIASAAGSMLPLIVDSFRSGKSPEEAQKMIAPQRQAMVERLIGSGMNMQQAEAMTDEAMADELAKAQLPEPMNPWLTAALAIGGGIGGYKLGAKFAPKGAPADVSKQAKMDTPAEQAAAKPASGQEPSPLEVQNAMTGGIGGPFPTKAAPRVANPKLTGTPQADMSAMLAGGPFPKKPPMDENEIDRLLAAIV
jgi:hypothetical protein